MASLWAPSATLKLGGVSITVTGHVGSIGGKVNIGSGNFELAGAAGVGVGINVKW